MGKLTAVDDPEMGSMSAALPRATPIMFGGCSVGMEARRGDEAEVSCFRPCGAVPRLV